MVPSRALLRPRPRRAIWLGTRRWCDDRVRGAALRGRDRAAGRAVALPMRGRPARPRDRASAAQAVVPAALGQPAGGRSEGPCGAARPACAPAPRRRRGRGHHRPLPLSSARGTRAAKRLEGRGAEGPQGPGGAAGDRHRPRTGPRRGAGRADGRAEDRGQTPGGHGLRAVDPSGAGLRDAEDGPRHHRGHAGAAEGPGGALRPPPTPEARPASSSAPSGSAPAPMEVMRLIDQELQAV